MTWQELLDYCLTIPPDYRDGAVRVYIDDTGTWPRVDVCEAIDDYIIGEGSPYLYLNGD